MRKNIGMNSIIYVVFAALIGIIEVVTLLMLIRAILSWFPVADRSSKVMSFIYMVTDAVIYPVRRLLDRFESLKRSPIDISFLVTYILLHIVQIILRSLMTSLIG